MKKIATILMTISILISCWNEQEKIWIVSDVQDIEVLKLEKKELINKLQDIEVLNLEEKELINKLQDIEVKTEKTDTDINEIENIKIEINFIIDNTYKELNIAKKNVDIEKILELQKKLRELKFSIKNKINTPSLNDFNKKF